MSEVANNSIDWDERLEIDTSYKSSTEVVIKSGINLPQSLDNLGFMCYNFGGQLGTGQGGGGSASPYLLDGQQVRYFLKGVFMA